MAYRKDEKPRLSFRRIFKSGYDNGSTSSGNITTPASKGGGIIASEADSRTAPVCRYATRHTILFLDSKPCPTRCMSVTDLGTSPQQTTAPPTKTPFWQIAYDDIINDEDAKTRNIVQAYDSLLICMEQQRRQSRLENVHGQGDGESLLPPGDEDGFTSGNDTVSLDRRVVGREEEMRAITAVRLEKMESKEWKMTWRGNVLKVREQVTGIINVVQRFSGLVSQTGSVSPEAGLAFSGVCVILEVRTKELPGRPFCQPRAVTNHISVFYAAHCRRHQRAGGRH